MDTPIDRLSSGYRPGSTRERLASSVLSFVVILIVVLAMIYQFVVSPQTQSTRHLTSFSFSDRDPDKAAQQSQARPKTPKVATRSPEKAVAPPKPRIAIQKQVERADAFDGIPGFIHMSRKDFAAADVGQIKGQPAKSSDEDGAGADASTAYGPGAGPGGVRLYRAEWYREPTQAEMVTYLPDGGAVQGWGEIACRTVEHYHVEDCQILGESPRGSGLGRAVQEAAWQFLVRPPRTGNKPMIGAWVSIRYTITMRSAG